VDLCEAALADTLDRVEAAWDLAPRSEW